MNTSNVICSVNDILLFRPSSLEREIAKLKLQDLHLVTPLGLGGFGSVILVSTLFANLCFSSFCLIYTTACLSKQITKEEASVGHSLE